MTSTAAISEQFEARGDQLPGSTELEPLRRAALVRFEAQGLPSRSIETWHYTDLRPLADKAFDFLAAPPDAEMLAGAKQALATLGLDDAAPLCVFVDGVLVRELSRLPAGLGVDFRSLDEHPADMLGGEIGDTALIALNTAFASGGAAIGVMRKLTNPLQLVFVGGAIGRARQLKLKLSLERGAAADVVLHFAALPGAGESWLNLLVDIEQAEASRLALYRLQCQGDGEYQTTLTRARLEADAELIVGSIELGGRLVRNELLVELAGTGARAEFAGLALTRDAQHCDCRVEIDHRAAATTSRQLYRTIADDQSRCVFNGKVTVREDAQQVDARQRNDNLLLSAKAEVDTKPELEIYADQVVCSHGATVGELSEDELFYLRARGIAAETARGILTAAFANAILERLAPAGFREQAQAAVAARLPRPVEPE